MIAIGIEIHFKWLIQRNVMNLNLRLSNFQNKSFNHVRETIYALIMT